jgi:hypothetical protein
MSIIRVELPISGVATHVDPIRSALLQGHMSQDAWKVFSKDLDKILEEK